MGLSHRVGYIFSSVVLDEVDTTRIGEEGKGKEEFLKWLAYSYIHGKYRCAMDVFCL